MGRKVSFAARRELAESRAIQIYEWAVSTENVFKSFTANMVPGYRPTSLNIAAMKVLVDRDLIGEVDCAVRPKQYRLKRRVPVSQCLNVPTDGIFTGVVRYKVPPYIAESMGRSDNLKQYAIG